MMNWTNAIAIGIGFLAMYFIGYALASEAFKNQEPSTKNQEQQRQSGT